MRRLLALLAAVVLAASLASSSLASTSTPKLGFVGDFVQLSDTGEVMGRITAQLAEPTEKQLVPGSHDFVGAPGNYVRESHAVIRSTGFWYDPQPGLEANVAYGDGVECVWFGVNDTVCHEWAVMFVDYVDASVPNQVAYSIVRDADGNWDFTPNPETAWWYTVGNGEFVMKGTFPLG
jgi:hypothetical protein